MRSSSASNESYVKTIEEMENLQRLALPDNDWIQFLLDHRSVIVEHSELTQLTPEVMYRYRYRIRDYLHEVHNDNVGMEQIFRIINRLYNDLDFNLQLTHAYVPDRTYCLNLRKRYNTYLGKQESAFK